MTLSKARMEADDWSKDKIKITIHSPVGSDVHIFDWSDAAALLDDLISLKKERKDAKHSTSTRHATGTRESLSESRGLQRDNAAQSAKVRAPEQEA